MKTNNAVHNKKDVIELECPACHGKIFNGNDIDREGDLDLVWLVCLLCGQIIKIYFNFFECKGSV